MDAAWHENDTGAVLADDEGELVGWLRLDHWYAAADTEPAVAWVAEYIDYQDVPPVMQRVLVDNDGTPAALAQRRFELVQLAEAAIAAGPPALSAPGWASAAQGRDEIELLVDAWSDAQDRVFAAATRTDEHAPNAVYVALTELLNWTYTLDGVLDVIWRKRLDPTIKEKVSQQVDVAMADVIKGNHARAAAHGETWSEPSTGIFRAYRMRQPGTPYPSWSHILGVKKKDLDPRFFNALKWVRGQLAHRGVIVAVDLQQWKPGAKPSWLWRQSGQIDHQTSKSEGAKLKDYDALLGGRSVVGTLNIINELAEAVEIFGGLLDDQAKLAGVTI